MQKKTKKKVTFSLFAYNQEDFIEEAIESAFNQTYSPLEIILSDDCSTDNTYNIMLEMAKNYKGKHSIILNRNNKNLGLINHINKVFKNLVSGDIIVMAAGDDISMPDRVTNTVEVFDKDPEITSVSLDYQSIDINGKIINKRKYFPKGYFSLSDFCKTKEFPKIGSSRAYKKKVFDIFGDLDAPFNVEDKSLVFRSLLTGKLFHISKIGLIYREGINSLSSTSRNIEFIDGVSSQAIKDLKKASLLGLINITDLTKSKKVVESVKKNFHLRHALKTNENWIFFYLSKIAFSKDFQIFEKIGLLKKCINKRILKK